MKRCLTTLLLLICSTPALAGLHYSGETYRELPARWTGYLPDHRALRMVAAPAFRTGPVPPLRDQYADAALKLDAAAKSRPLTADEAADLGALYVRLGQPHKAVEVLRPAARAHPEHFRLAANLGTAWQLAGELQLAADHLEEAVSLAPDQWKDAEALHLKLVRLRLKEGKLKDPPAPDDLFGVAFVGESGSPEAGALAAAERKKLPPNAVALVQQLALWFPVDGRLLWLLAELANAHGDSRTAANLLDGCVTEFGMASNDLRGRRQHYRAAADEAEKKGHKPAAGTILFKSPRALTRGLDPARLPPVNPDGVNPLLWAAVGETELGPRGIPTFLKYVEQLDGKKVTVTGFMTPAGNPGNELTGFLFTENPVGCWFCETPGPTQVLLVELSDGKTTEPSRVVLKVTGTLKLNRSDPERFPFTITDAAAGPAD